MAFHPITQKAAPAGQSILRLRRAPSSRGYSAVARRSRAAHGMTKRGTGYLTFHLIPLREPTSAPSGHLLPEEGGRYENAAQGLSLNPLNPTICFHRKEHS